MWCIVQLYVAYAQTRVEASAYSCGCCYLMGKLRTRMGIWPPKFTSPAKLEAPVTMTLNALPRSSLIFVIPLLFIVGLPGNALASRIISVETLSAAGESVVGGTVIPYAEVTLTAQMPGRVEHLSGREGDAFERGQLLVALDSSALMARRQAALANLQRAEVSLRESQVQYSRELVAPQSRDIGRMPGMGMPSMFDNLFTRQFGQFAGYGDPTVDRHADLHARSAGVEQAMTQISQARSQLEEIDAQLRDLRSIAPFDGVIMYKFIEVGDTVQAGQPLVVFAHTHFLRIRAEVPARLVPQLQIGQIMPARLDVGNTPVQARVSQIFPEASRERHTVTVKFDLPSNAPGGPGMYAEVIIPDPSSDARSQVLIPRTAIVPGGSLPRVLVVDQQGRSSLRAVRLGGERNDMYLVLSGLNPGDRIIDAPPPGATSGWMPSAR